jgi:hypothetical protein
MIISLGAYLRRNALAVIIPLAGYSWEKMRERMDDA